jgi:hypothetical protein
MRWPWVALIAVLGIGLLHDVILLSRSPVAVGIDGYYYVLQINSLRNSGHLYYSTSTPLILYFLAGLSFPAGNAILAIKIGSVLLHTLLSWGLFAIVTIVTRRPWLGVLASIIATASGLHLYLIVEFINSLGALTLLVWCAWGTIQAIEARSKLWSVFASCLLVAALYSHRSIWAVAPLITIFVFLAWLLRRVMICENKYRYFASPIYLLSLIAPLIILVLPSSELPVLLRDDVLQSPRWPISHFAGAEGIALLIAVPATLFFLMREGNVSKGAAGYLLFGSTALWSLGTTLNPFLNHNAGLEGVTGRLTILAYVQAALLLPGLVWWVAPVYRPVTSYLLALFVPFVTFSATATIPYGLTVEYLRERERLIEWLPLQRQRLCDVPIIIAPHGDQFVVTATLGVPAQLSPPSSAQYKCTYWLLHRPLTTSPTQSDESVTNNESSRILIEDDRLWRQIEIMSDNESFRLRTINPHLYNSPSVLKRR